MTVLSPARASVPTLPGLHLAGQGKVRDTYELSQGLLLPVTSDGGSIYDFVLNVLIPDKGWVLNVVNHFFHTHLESNGYPTDLVRAGSAIDTYLPEHLRGDPYLQCRAMVVRKLTMYPIEFVGRKYLAGSALDEYRKKGTIAGEPMPVGLQEGDELPRRLFTPTTKAHEGHDMPLDPETVRSQYPSASSLFLRAQEECARIAERCGLTMADGKGEIGVDENGDERIGDEIGTPDSTRYWDRNDKARTSLDKQLLRNWGESVGIKGRDPMDADDIAYAQSQIPPTHVIEALRMTYRGLVPRFTHLSLEDYTTHVLGVEMN